VVIEIDGEQLPHALPLPWRAARKQSWLVSVDEAVAYPLRADDDRGSPAEPERSGREREPFAHLALGLSLSPLAAWRRSTQKENLSKHDSEQKLRKRKKTGPEELLTAIAETVDDGFYPVSSLVSRFPKLSHRDLLRLRGQALRRGLLLERRGPDGRVYLALTSEGWRALRASRTF
jgi:hypothetical protein